MFKKLFKGCLTIFFTLFFLSFLLIRFPEFIVKKAILEPKVEEVTADLVSYIEINDRALTEEYIINYINNKKESGYIKTDQELSLNYVQAANDKRYKLRVTLSGGSYFNDFVTGGYVVSELQGSRYSVPRSTIYRTSQFNEKMKSTDLTSVKADNGNELYQRMCASCHGGQLEGSVGPNLTNLKSSETYESIYNFLINEELHSDLISEEETSLIAEWLIGYQ
ncbi:c-type cytochrome [Guptibacillus algicola]|uniref:c-type cytochrome n=1 Tax=Guptibacillus algicola TaxID=225844 RepID=UPI001CD227C6|nr:cytochrome c [Alkalihalobacillus algicola]MCA0987023.1 cytochrome c [Alkalihalobacillus algicola]